jgi:acetyl-CoA carboxylase biotin carboxyl carrier protein
MTEKDRPKAAPQGDRAAKTRPNIDPAFVRELATLLDETGLTEIEIEETGTRIRVVRQAAHMIAAPAAPAAAVSPAPAKPTEAAKRGTLVTSPMVGTAYLGPEPGAPPFVKAGETVKDGQTILIIEAMKTMNQVPSTIAGKIIEIYVQDGQPVEFGEPLMLVD